MLLVVFKYDTDRELNVLRYSATKLLITTSDSKVDERVVADWMLTFVASVIGYFGREMMTVSPTAIPQVSNTRL
jgi:hypothetical protein